MGLVQYLRPIGVNFESVGVDSGYVGIDFMFGESIWANSLGKHSG